MWRRLGNFLRELTTADDVSALSVDTLFFESSVSTERETGERCSPHLVAGRRRRTCGADSSISSVSCTTADDVSAMSVDTLQLESGVSTQWPGGLHRQLHEDVRDTMP